MKWKEWSETHYVLVTSEGEIVDEIKRDDNYFFILKSTGTKYIDVKSAKKARITGVPENGKRD